MDILSDVIEEGEPASKKLKSTMNQVQCKERMVKSSFVQDLNFRAMSGFFSFTGLVTARRVEEVGASQCIAFGLV